MGMIFVEIRKQLIAS